MKLEDDIKKAVEVMRKGGTLAGLQSVGPQRVGTTESTHVQTGSVQIRVIQGQRCL